MIRRLLVVLGDQLDPASALFAGADPAQDALWMAEVAAESTVVWSHRQRIALFLAAMRHFAAGRRAAGWTVHYQALEDPGAARSLGSALAGFLGRVPVAEVQVVEPGEWRVAQALRRAVGTVPLTILPDQHFLCATAEFAAWWDAQGQPRQEWFYRWMRRRLGVLMDGDTPVGGRWNFDHDNRGAFGASGPGPVPAPRAFAPDALTQEVLALVARRFPDHPGSLASFAWPVTPDQAEDLLEDFIAHRLAAFGRYQDARWDAEPVLFHSRLSAAMNLKLIDPRRIIARVEAAWQAGLVPLASAEGFLRQVIGWREWVRGVYHRLMPAYGERNALEAHEPLPAWYWTGDTDRACLRQALHDTLEHAYAHHIQRLMVTGLYALLLGVEPQQVHAWYLAVYADAVEWAELPNTLGMALYADGGVMATKPYCASGAYHARMGDSCRRCRYDPAQATGPTACPFTTLYWDFLGRHRERFARHPRLAQQIRNWERLPVERQTAIAAQAEALRRAGG